MGPSNRKRGTPMNEIEVKACAKLNLSLDVLGRLDNGYHEMKMVMQTASLCDDVAVRLTDGGGITVQSNFGFLPRDGNNIAAKAAAAFFAAADMPGAGAAITLRKRIPVGAGLGGGSADAAAVLRALNALCGAPLGIPALEALGETLGSDVPFCVRGGTRLAVGRGERLLPAPGMPPCGIVICKPRFSIRTPDLFARIDSRRSRIHPDTDGLLCAMAAGDLPGLARRMYNVFEDVLPRSCSEIGAIKHALLDAGALGAVMTGTGSAVFGLFPDGEGAKTAAAALKARWRDSFAAAPVRETDAEEKEA